jgi:hypothetical protein
LHKKDSPLAKWCTEYIVVLLAATGRATAATLLPILPRLGGAQSANRAEQRSVIITDIVACEWPSTGGAVGRSRAIVPTPHGPRRLRVG